LPVDWQDGQALRIEKADDVDTPIEEIDRDFDMLARLCESGEPADEEDLERALQEARRQAKEQVRRHYGAVYVELRREGRVLSQVDMMLAALARQHKLIVLTTDRDFEALTDLRVENWVN